MRIYVFLIDIPEQDVVRGTGRRMVFLRTPKEKKYFNGVIVVFYDDHTFDFRQKCDI